MTDDSNLNTGHGHVRERPDGVRARCGGPSMCRECQREKAQLDQKPIEDQPLPAGEPPNAALAFANERVGAMVKAIVLHVSQAGQVNPASLVADSALGAQRLQILLRMLLEPQGDRPAILDKDEFNRLLGEACERVTASLQKPKIQLAVADALRPRH